MFSNENNYHGAKVDDKVETIIGPSVTVEGTLNSSGNINIEGEFKGKLNVRSKLTVGRDASLEAEIGAENAFIAGKVKGNLNVDQRLELSNTARIDGDVKAGTMIMEAGAVLNGKCQMGEGANNDIEKDKEATDTQEDFSPNENED